MELRVIRTEAEYEAALARAGELLEVPAGSAEAEHLAVLAVLIEAYEREHYPLRKPTPAEAIAFRMEQAGITRKDLEPYIGSRARVSEVLTGVRALTLPMVRRLHEGLGIPLEALVGPAPARVRDTRSAKQRGSKRPARAEHTASSTRRAAKRRAA